MNVDKVTTYRHPARDVDVSLERLSALLATVGEGVPITGRVAPIRKVDADSWNLAVVVEELRAQLEENPAGNAHDPKLAEVIESLDAWLSTTLMSPDGYTEIRVPHAAPFALQTAMFSSLLRRANIGNRFGSTPERTKVGDVTVTVRPELDTEALGDLASDLAEAIATRLADRAPVLTPGAGDTALALAVEHHGHHGTRNDVTTATAEAFLRFLSTGRAVKTPRPPRHVGSTRLAEWLHGSHFDGVEGSFTLTITGPDAAEDFEIYLDGLRQIADFVEEVKE